MTDQEQEYSKLSTQHKLNGAAPRLSHPRRRLLACAVATSAAVAAPAHAATDLAPVNFQLEQPAAAVATPAIADDDQALRLLTPVQLQVDLASAATAASSAQGERRGDARLSFGEHVESIKWELAALFAYQTVLNAGKIVHRGETSAFHFENEGFFGKDTYELGVDKLTHAHNSYVQSEIIGARIRKKTGTTRGTALTGAVLSSGMMLYSEVFDGFKGGFGYEDLVFNTLGAGFSVLRNTTPGLDEKLDFRVLVIPNRQVYSPTGRDHYRQSRYLFALKLAGFDRLKDSPLRFAELHAGYYATGFTEREEDRGEPRQRKLFAGVGVNLSELLFGRKRETRFQRIGSEALQYWQPPLTYVHAKENF